MKACLVVVVASIFVQSLLFVPFACAEPRKWQTATVVKADFGGTKTEAVAVPLPGGARLLVRVRPAQESTGAEPTL
jgi:hypothetical protein